MNKLNWSIEKEAAKQTWGLREGSKEEVVLNWELKVEFAKLSR